MRDFIESIIVDAGTILLEKQKDVTVSCKDGAKNTVTEADLASEAFITTKIKEQFPGHLVLGEEAHQDVSLDAEHLWIIDPLDGTNNYASGMPHFSISIAYCEKGEVIAGSVYDPSRKELFSAVKNSGAYLNGEKISVAQRETLAEALICTGFYYDRGQMMEETLEAIKRLFHKGIRGLRRSGSAALDLAWTAAGRFDGFFEYELHPWDFAAGILLVAEAGGVGSDIDGSSLSVKARGNIVSSPHIEKDFLEIVKWRLD